MAIRRIKLSERMLLARYLGTGAYTDCYTTPLPGQVNLADYVEAFYCTPLFKLERWFLGWAVGKPATDADARELGAGERVLFSAWKLEGRTADQLLLMDYTASTRSWFMVEPDPDTGGTRLCFGSAVMPRQKPGGKPRLSWTFRLLLGFHKLYSRGLLGSARRRLERSATMELAGR